MPFARACADLARFSICAPGVVVVELAHHFGARRREQAREAISDRCGTAVADVQRPGRVCGDEFNAGFAARADRVAAVLRCGGVHRADFLVIGRGAQEEIDEPRSRDLDFREQRALRQRGDERLRERARVGARGFGEQHRGIAGEVAVVTVLRALDDDRPQPRRRAACRRHACDRAPDRSKGVAVLSQGNRISRNVGYFRASRG